MHQLLERFGQRCTVLPGAGILAPKRYSWSQVSPRSPPTIHAEKELKAFFSHSVTINRELQQHLSSYSARFPGNLETANFISLQNAAAPCNSQQQRAPLLFTHSALPSPALCVAQRGSLLSETFLSLAFAFTGLVAQHKAPHQGLCSRCAPVNMPYLHCVEYVSILKGLIHGLQLKSLLGQTKFHLMCYCLFLLSCFAGVIVCSLSEFVLESMLASSLLFLSHS